jgi:hypothetical protein
LFSTLQYNSSLPGALKNALDWVSRLVATNTMSNRPVAVIGASASGFGAVWSQAELRKVLAAMGGRVVEAVAVGTRWTTWTRAADPTARPSKRGFARSSGAARGSQCANDDRSSSGVTLRADLESRDATVVEDESGAKINDAAGEVAFEVVGHDPRGRVERDRACQRAGVVELDRRTRERVSDLPETVPSASPCPTSPTRWRAGALSAAASGAIGSVADLTPAAAAIFPP